MAPAAPAPEMSLRAIDPAYAAAWQAVRSAHQTVVEIIELELSDAGLPDLAWYDVMVKLEGSAGPVRPKDMLCQVSVTKSGLTRLLDRIEKAGLIERGQCPSDRRGTYLSITDAGVSTLAEMRPIRDRAFEEHFVDRLSPEEARMLGESLSRVSASAVGQLETEGGCEV